MMHRSCSASSTHQMGHCTCGMFHGQNNSFSMLFSKPYDESDTYNCFNPSSSSSVVDCTLSLGTPSTRFTEDEEKRNRHEQRRSVKNFCWDLLQPKHNNVQSQTKITRGTTNIVNNNNNDSLLARRCANCDTTSTPLWRNGPRGPKSLCNACGIRFKKEERRASAAAVTPTAVSGGVMESAPIYNHHNNSWYVHPQNQKMQCFSPAMSNEFRFVDETDRESDNGIPFLSWRLNVTDRTSFVHDFTR
ncbi:GATA transcription factor 18 [Cicer arietinum]|uniref:GATA transcription factor 18 n=1 Tax=Cicer arietinum TaxID=3827 RepID=A0A1S2YYR5_CICAR|nr:GATA transcription factor 18 [Cicer arietinum]